MTNKIGFPKLCANETLLNEYYKDVSFVIDLNAKSFLCLLGFVVVCSCLCWISCSPPRSSSRSLLRLFLFLLLRANYQHWPFLY